MSKNHKLNQLARNGVSPDDIDDFYADELDILESEARVKDDEWQ